MHLKHDSRIIQCSYFIENITTFKYGTGLLPEITTKARHIIAKVK